MNYKPEIKISRLTKRSPQGGREAGQQSLLFAATKNGFDSLTEILSHIDDVGSDLARPALLIAKDENPNLNVQHYLNMLDDLADEAFQRCILDSKSEADGAKKLAHFLAFDKGFIGNQQNYYDPRNSFLSDVLDRRIGIPITLSLVLIEVGRRLGLPLIGIGFPGHFLVGLQSQRRGKHLILDPFCEGRNIGIDECELRLKSKGYQFNPDQHLKPITNRGFIIRLLDNLKNGYLHKGDIHKAIRTIERLIILNPKSHLEYMQLGIHYAEKMNYHESRAFLKSYLEHNALGEEADAVRSLISHLNKVRANRN